MPLSWLQSPCVSVAPPSPEEPTESQASHTHTHTGQCGARVLPTLWRPYTELSSGIPVYDLHAEAVMKMHGDGWDGVLKVSFVRRTVAAKEPTERVSGTGARG